jgi:transportin-3
MMFTFPGDCFPDASGVLMTLFEMLPQEAGTWVQSTLQMLPPGSIKPGESERLMKGISDKIQIGEMRRIRVLLQGSAHLPQLVGYHISSHQLITRADFTNSYRRRNVAPREGLGRLEATRFRFSG